jgi:hypothetical protein
MKTLVAGLILFTIPAFRPNPPAPRQPTGTIVSKSHAGGRWYLAASGHAVYCRGPVITINMLDGGPRKVATYCQGQKPIVPLKD